MSNRSTTRPCPSPSGRNDANLFLKTTLVRGSAPLANDSSALSRALKAKYRTAADACRALDINPELLQEREADDRRHHADDDVHEMVETMPPQRMSAAKSAEAEDDEDERDEYGAFSDYLRDRGIGEDVIRGAIDWHRRQRGMDRRRANGHDRHADDRRNARDRLPHRGGHFNKPRFSRDKARDEFMLPPQSGGGTQMLRDHGFDEESFHERFPEAARIQHEPEVRTMDRLPHNHPSRRRHAMDSKPGMNEAQKARLFKLIPEIERLEDGRRNWDVKGRYEI